MRFQGPCWTVGDNIPTDHIVKSHLVILPPEELARLVLQDVNPRFGSHVQAGDILVAGKHFGQSSGRAIAAKALKATGVGVVVAESFARTFYRNCFEIGLPVVECVGISEQVTEGQRLLVDLAAETVVNLDTGARLRCDPVDPFLRRMSVAGGLIALVKQHGERWAEGPAADSSPS